MVRGDDGVYAFRPPVLGVLPVLLLGVCCVVGSWWLRDDWRERLVLLGALTVFASVAATLTREGASLRMSEEGAEVLDTTRRWHFFAWRQVDSIKTEPDLSPKIAFHLKDGQTVLAFAGRMRDAEKARQLALKLQSSSVETPHANVRARIASHRETARTSLGPYVGFAIFLGMQGEAFLSVFFGLAALVGIFASVWLPQPTVEGSVEGLQLWPRRGCAVRLDWAEIVGARMEHGPLQDVLVVDRVGAEPVRVPWVLRAVPCLEAAKSINDLMDSVRSLESGRGTSPVQGGRVEVSE